MHVFRSLLMHKTQPFLLQRYLQRVSLCSTHLIVLLKSLLKTSSITNSSTSEIWKSKAHMAWAHAKSPVVCTFEMTTGKKYLQKIGCDLRLEVVGNCSSYQVGSHSVFQNKSTEAYHYRVHQINYPTGFVNRSYISLLWYTTFWVSVSPGRYDPSSPLEGAFNDWQGTKRAAFKQNKQEQCTSQVELTWKKQGLTPQTLCGMVYQHTLSTMDSKTSQQHHGSFPLTSVRDVFLLGLKSLDLFLTLHSLSLFACCQERPLYAEANSSAHYCLMHSNTIFEVHKRN